MMAEKNKIEWNARKYPKQEEINKLIEQHFGPKKIAEYLENGKVVTVYESR